MLHIKEEAKKEVKPREFWIAIAIVAVLLGGIGIYTLQNKKIPEMPGWLLGVMLGMVWAGAIINLVRNRRILFMPMYVLNLIGYTLFATGKLAPQWWQGIGNPETVSWLGSMLVFMALLSQFIGIGKARRAPETTTVEPERIAAR